MAEAYGLASRYDSISISGDSRLLGLPIELLDMIISYLGRPEWTQLRLTNKYFKQIATPHCFRKVQFELSDHGVEHLIHIALHQDLCQHVKKLVLRRNQGLRDFSDFDSWERSISLEGDPDFDDSDNKSDSDSNYDVDSSLMSYQEWSALPHNDKEALYHEYEADRKQAQDQVRSLTYHLYFHTSGYIQGERVHPEGISTPTAEASPLEHLDQAMKNLTNLTVFKHKPGFLFNDRWGCRWRQLRISLESIILCTTDEEDEDVEALQLSYVLQALGWTKRFHPKLRSMSFYVGGPAFWGVERLRCLWEGKGHGRIRDIRDQMQRYGNVLQMDGETYPKDEKLFLRREKYLRQLIIMQHALEHLTYLDCSISDDDEEYGGLLNAAGQLFEFLRCAKKLEQLELAFGRLVDGFLQPGNVMCPHGDGPTELLALLAEHAPWSKIRELNLSIVTDERALLSFLSSLASTLRHLALSRITLVRHGGTWESALHAIKDTLSLDSLNLEQVCDHVPDQRILFDRDAAVWKDKKICYSHYESVVVEHLLHTGESFLLEPASFLQDHSVNCKWA